MTADQHIRTIIGDLIVKSAILLEQLDVAQARITDLEAKYEPKVAKVDG